MTFIGTYSYIKFLFIINKSVNKFSGEYFRDFGFCLSRTLSPRLHIQEIYSKAHKHLGCFQRTICDFKQTAPLKSL